jgi:hypothetical protein
MCFLLYVCRGLCICRWVWGVRVCLSGFGLCVCVGSVWLLVCVDVPDRVCEWVCLFGTVCVGGVAVCGLVCAWV